ncbi:hypothetical protein ACROYT_G036279 [Oculina patagonica]
MKRTFLILVALFLVFDCSWAKPKDAETFLLSSNHAKSFLKRQHDWSICDEVHYQAYQMQVDIHEECCGEVCESEEMEESYGYLPNHNPEQKREQYVANCC